MSARVWSVIGLGLGLGLGLEDLRADPRAYADVERAEAARDDLPDDLPDDRPDAAEPPGTTVPAPPIEEVLAAAYAAAGLDRDPGRGLARRARLAGLVPWLSVRTLRDTSWRDGEPNIGRGLTLEVRASWRLDRLVFDGRELQVAGLQAARRRERRSLASAVIRSYFFWLRAAAERRGSLRARAAAAELDALTGGWFSSALVEARRTASETRTPGAGGRPPADTP